MRTPETNSNDLAARLKAAVNSEEVPPFVEARIRHLIKSEAVPRRRPSMKLATAGAALLLCLGLGIAYELGHLRITAESQESYIASISSQVAGLLRIGLGDHVHCAVFRKLPKTPPTVRELEGTLGPQDKDLISIVAARVPGEYRLLVAHHCRYQGRRFTHLTLQGDSQLLSLVITAKQDGESFSLQGLLPDLANAGIPVYRGEVQRFQIAALETRDHLVYLISDLPATANLELIQAMAPELRKFLAKREG